MKDDSGAYAVFTEQGSSASQMTVAKIMDVIARLSFCDGEATDVVSVHTQVKLEDAPRVLKFPKSECPDVLDMSFTTLMAKILGNIEDLVVPLERN